MSVKKIFTVLIVASAFLLLMTNVFGEPTLSFWCNPFVGGSSNDMTIVVPFFNKTVAASLTDFHVSTYFGPAQSYTTLLQNFIMKAKTGQPDVVEGLIEQLQTYTRMGLIANLTDLFNSWQEKDQFFPNTIEACTINGQLMGIPYNMNARGLIYRKDIFDKYHLAVPTTWSEYIKTASEITKLTGGKIYGTAFTSAQDDVRALQEFVSWYFQVSKRAPMFTINNGTVTLNATPGEFEKVLDLYYDLTYSDPQYPPTNPQAKGMNYTALDLGYVSGKYAMIPDGPWMLAYSGQSAEASEILYHDTAVAPLPIPKDGVRASYLEVKPIMINKYSNHNIQLDWDLVKFIVSKDMMTVWASNEGFLPTRKDVLNTPEFDNWWIKMWKPLLPDGVALSPINWDPVTTDITNAIDEVIYGTSKPHNAAIKLWNELTSLASSGVLGK